MSPQAHLRGRAVQAGDEAAFVAAYGHLFEYSPWIVEAAWKSRPFADAAALHEAFVSVIEAAPKDQQLALVRAHPELADKVAMATGLTQESAREQASAGLDRLSPAEFETFHAMNRTYRERYGFPFVICVRLHDKADILAAMSRRLEGDAEAELAEALVQIGYISALRLADVRVEALTA
jgi:2-oxo-4-hydroxy-4-carboxy-5-ureidoimidazoline decarboxylase